MRRREKRKGVICGRKRQLPDPGSRVRYDALAVPAAPVRLMVGKKAARRAYPGVCATQPVPAANVPRRQQI